MISNNKKLNQETTKTENPKKLSFDTKNNKHMKRIKTVPNLALSHMNENKGKHLMNKKESSIIFKPNKKQNRYLTKSMSNTTLPNIYQKHSHTHSFSIPQQNQNTINNHKTLTNKHITEVLKLEKIVHNYREKYLSKSKSTSILKSKKYAKYPKNAKSEIDINILKNQGIFHNKNNLSWSKHLQLLQEYDMNRVLLQELCITVQQSHQTTTNKDCLNLIQNTLIRNHEISKCISNALGYERNKIDTLQKNNLSLSSAKNKSQSNLLQLQSDFHDIQYKIKEFNESQTQHTRMLQLAKESAYDCKHKYQNKNYENHILQLHFNRQRDEYVKHVQKLQSKLQVSDINLAEFQGYAIEKIFTKYENILDIIARNEKSQNKVLEHEHKNESEEQSPHYSAHNENTDSKILLIIGFTFNFPLVVIRSWFGKIKVKNMSPLFPSCIYHCDANVELLLYAIFVEFDSIQSSKFILELLNGRKICSKKVLSVYFAKEYPSKCISVRSEFNREQILDVYQRFGRICNVTKSGQSFIIRFVDEGQASAAILNTHGRRFTVKNMSNEKTLTSLIDAQFANDVSNITWDENEPHLRLLTKEMEAKIYKVEDSLDTNENILAIEYFPSENVVKKEERLQLQKQYEPPNMSLIKKYNSMITDVQNRTRTIEREIIILQSVASGNPALRHLRKYIDPEQPTHEELNKIIDEKTLEGRKFGKMTEIWKKKCVAFDEELESCKQKLLQFRIRYQSLKRMRRGKKMQTEKLKNKKTFTLEDIPLLEEKIDELEMQMCIAQETIIEYESNGVNSNIVSQQISPEMEIKIELLEEQLVEKNERIMFAKAQIKSLKSELFAKEQKEHELEENQPPQMSNISSTNIPPVSVAALATELISQQRNTGTIIDVLRKDLHQKNNDMQDITEELKESRKQLQQLKAASKSNKTAEMLQQYMSENEKLKREMRKTKRKLENTLLKMENSIEKQIENTDNLQSTTNATPTPTSNANVTITPNANVTTTSKTNDNEKNVDNKKSQEKCNEFEEKIKELKKHNTQLNNVIELKCLELSKMRDEIASLRQAKELCETLHVLDDETDDEEESMKQQTPNTSTSVAKRTSSRASTSRSNGRALSSKQQKKIAEILKSRDESEKKVHQMREKSLHLEQQIKKLKKEIKNIKNRAHDNVRRNSRRNSSSSSIKLLTNDMSAQLVISDTSDDELSTIDTNSSTMIEKTTPKTMHTPTKSSTSTKHASKISTKRTSKVSTKHTSKTSTKHTTKTTTPKNHSSRSMRRSYSCAPSTSTPNAQLSNLTYEQLQSEIKKLRKELNFYKTEQSSLTSSAPHTSSTNNTSTIIKLISREKDTKSEIKDKPLMVKKPRKKSPKAKRKVEKKWKMTKSRFQEITSGVHSKRKLKTKRWLLKTINDIYDHKYKSDLNCVRENRQILHLPEFIYHEYIPSRFGIKNLVDAMCADIHHAVQHYHKIKKNSTKNSSSKEEYQEITTFKKFLEEDLELNDLTFYLKARSVLISSKSTLINNYIPFKCIAQLLQNIFEGTFPHFLIKLDLNLQALALLNNISSESTADTQENSIHKDLFLDYIIKENKILLHEYIKNIRILYFHLNFNNKTVVKNSDYYHAIQFMLQGIPNKTIDHIMSNLKLVKNECETDDEQISENFGIAENSDKNKQAFEKFVHLCKNLFSYKQQFYIPALNYNSNIFQSNGQIIKSVGIRWNEFKDNMIFPILEMFENQAEIYVVNMSTGMVNDNNTDILQVKQIISEINVYCEEIERFIGLKMGWDSFMMYSRILNLMVNGFEMLEKCELKRQLSKTDVNATKSIDAYLYTIEDEVMRRLKRAVTAKRPSSHSARSAAKNNLQIEDTHYLQLKQQVIQM